MRNPAIYILFENCEFELTCLNIVSSSFFIKQTIDIFDTLECIFLKSDVSLSEEAQEIMENLLCYDFADICLTKIIDSETGTEMSVTYVFNESGVEYIEANLTPDLEKEILLLLDCLDIKAYLVALLSYLTKRERNYEELLNSIRKDRYEMPILYTKERT